MGVYNAGIHLEGAIRSILAQSFTDFEMLIIDDGSTDDSAERVARLEREDARIRLIRNSVNRGLGAVLREGVDLARGELLARMDADDLARPDRLERQVEFLDLHPQVHIVGSYATDIDEEGTALKLRRVPVEHERIVEVIWSCPMIHPTVMLRRQALLAVGSYRADVRRRQDYELWFRCAHAGLRFANIPEPLLSYRYSSATLRRNGIRSAWRQVRMGLVGCRMMGAGPAAYLATAAPLFEAMLPGGLRARLLRLKARVDPRNAA